MGRQATRLRPIVRPSIARRVNVYVASEDQEVWNRARVACRASGVSLASMIADALDRYMR